MSIRRMLLPWCEHICTLYFAVGKTSLTLCSPSCFTHKYVNLYMTLPFFFLAGFHLWPVDLSSSSFSTIIFHLQLLPQSPPSQWLHHQRSMHLKEILSHCPVHLLPQVGQLVGWQLTGLTGRRAEVHQWWWVYFYPNQLQGCVAASVAK